MEMDALYGVSLQAQLKTKEICRFCLSQDHSKLTNIYERDTHIKSSAPLPIQIMAIVSIEVFSDDDMPCYVCVDCTNNFELSYKFKQMCKKADDLLRQFPLTGQWPESLENPVLLTNQFLKKELTMKENNDEISVDDMNRHVALADVSDNHIDPPVFPAANQITKTKLLNKTSLVIHRDQAEPENKTSFISTKNNSKKNDIMYSCKKPYKCSLCIETFSSSNMLTRHEKIHTDVPKYICGHCDQSFFLKDHLEKHAKRHSIKRSIICRKCNKRFASKQSLVRHEIKHKAETDTNNTTVIKTNIFPCSHCDRSFPLLQLRDIHMKNHFRDRKFQCDCCGKSFFNKYELERHSVVHSGKKNFKCFVCDKAFHRRSYLNRHQKTHTDVPKYICPICKLSFLLKEDMQKHEEKHKNQKFICKICNKGFAFKQGLERHKLILHSRQQPYICQYCKEGFSTTTKLARHLITHAGVRPYPCKYCKKSFTLIHHLTRHLRCHKNVNDPCDEVSFNCMRCSCNSETRDELISHSTTHANETNLACSLCKDIFDNISDLKSHIQYHSHGKVYACRFCDLIFLTAGKLRSHLDIDHINEIEDELLVDHKSQIHIIDIADEKLQETTYDFSVNTLPCERSESNISLKKDIKVETETTSSKLINQVFLSHNDEIEGNIIKVENER